MREDLVAFFDFDDVVDDAAHRIAHRREGATDVQQIVAKLGDAISRHRRGLRLDPVLELVDLRVDVVDEIEIALGDVVDEPVRDHPGRVRLAHSARAGSGS